VSKDTYTVAKVSNDTYVCRTIRYKYKELFITIYMPMYFEQTRREIRELLKGLNPKEECQFDVRESLRVRQIISEIHQYTDLKFETSTKNKQLPDKLLVKRVN